MLRKFLIVSMFGLAGAAAIPPRATAQSNSEEVLFRQRCLSCHVVTPESRPGPLGPNLRGVVGRKAGSTSFPGYSVAMKNSNVVWSRANIERYLTAPSRMIPRTRMTVVVADPKSRQALVNYLIGL